METEEMNEDLTGVSDAAIDELMELEEADKLTPEAVVSRAKDPGSALHAHIFGDSDDEAAYHWRLVRARNLIQRVKVDVRVTGGAIVHTTVQINDIVVPERNTRPRAFVHIESEGRYVRTERAMREHRLEVEAILRGEVQRVMRRYVSIMGLEKARDIAQEAIENL